MKTILKYAKLPFTFSVEKMQAELQAISARWVPHYNALDYEGDWSALPLRSPGGKMDNIQVQTIGQVVFADTPLMQACPYLTSVISTFRCPLNAVRLLNLRSGATIKEHTDAELGYEYGEARIHIPITTNDGVGFYLQDEEMVLAVGDCWYLNFSLPHRIHNAGATDRVHLVIDLMVNDELRAIFENTPPAQKRYIPAAEIHSAAEKANIIAQLRQMNTSTSLQLAASMQAELA